jgi:hypothetical protein
MSVLDATFVPAERTKQRPRSQDRAAPSNEKEDGPPRRARSCGVRLSCTLLMLAVPPSCHNSPGGQRQGAAWTNEPAGLTVATDWPFTVLSGAGWSGWGGVVGIDSTAPASPPSVLELDYPIGFVAGNSPGQENFDFAAALPTEIFIGMWWRTSNQVAVSVGPRQDLLRRGYHGWWPRSIPVQQGPAPHNLTVTTQTGAENRNLPRVAQTPVSPGVWHRIEMYLRWSTRGRASCVGGWTASCRAMGGTSAG